MSTESTRAVVVDDEPLMRQALRLILKKLGVKVVAEAGNAADAMSAVLRTEPNLVLLDINMPGRDGLALLEDIRGKGLQCEIIMISADATLDKVKQALKAGARDFIVKPFNPLQVMERLGKVIDVQPDGA